MPRGIAEFVGLVIKAHRRRAAFKLQCFAITTFLVFTELKQIIFKRGDMQMQRPVLLQIKNWTLQ